MNLNIESLGKRYRGNVWGLRKFSLNVQPGLLGLLGPNGAGKSTLMRILATVTRATEGSVTFNDVDIERSPNNVRTVLGYLPQDFGVYPHLNAVEFLTYLAAAKGIGGAGQRIDQLLELVNLTEARKRPLGSLSGGMKQRVGIAQALLNDPKLLIVDEPTVGLDPEERVRFRNSLSELAGERIVILSSHIVSDVAAIATRVAIINRGRLIAQATPEELLRSVHGKVWEWVVPSTELPKLQQRLLISSSIRTDQGVRIRVVEESCPDESAEAASPTLEDAYLYILAHDRNNGNSARQPSERS
ncbi:MAG: ATP-binding cassette domain-containing protein [candidate division Zixibacteria bacterium]|nr:ATP-binding cassette domain-containing protein [candidate division Zixibacteria bacterium]MDH3937282.1 ATP-binding cassette domain-containing protein [candidate division Zixibacteria bacterium]MDH4033340.1 ATP-binding cassette domain-containing protein [candidate division Zixibacteria bacterium]